MQFVDYDNEEISISARLIPPKIKSSNSPNSRDWKSMKSIEMQSSPKSDSSPSKSSVEFVQFLRRSSRVEVKKSSLTKLPWLDKLIYTWNDGYLKYIFSYILWIIIGTVYYGLAEFNSYGKGFYFSINVGYSIGWGVLSLKKDSSKIFSVFYLLVGAIFISRWLAFLLQNVADDDNSSYERMILRKTLMAQSRLTGWWLEVYVFLVVYSSKLLIIYLWILFVMFGTTWSCSVIHEWTFADGILFATSSLSTGGLQGIPFHSDDSMFFLVGMYAATGVPIMGMAMGNIANIIVEVKAQSELRTINTVRADDKVDHLLEIIKSDNQKQSFDRNEFLVLSLFKQGKLSVDEVNSVYQDFDKLLDSQDHGLINRDDLLIRIEKT